MQNELLKKKKFRCQTAYSTQWALFILSSNMSEQSKIRAQLNGVNFETPLIRGAVKESLRLFPVATFIGRILPMDGIIGNYRIPKHVKINFAIAINNES